VATVATVPHAEMAHLATMIVVLVVTTLALAISHAALVVPILKLLPNCLSVQKPSV
jgi:hypothetical protein